jgi:hypothetical protein
MGYNAKRRAFEKASKSGHIEIVKDKVVKEFITNHEFPQNIDNIDINTDLTCKIDTNKIKNLEHIIAVDGGNTTVPVKSKFPSSTITFFQFGGNYLNIKDLEDLKKEPFISPSQISKLKELQKIKLVLPTKNVGRKSSKGFRLSITNSVRNALQEFFEKNGYLETLKWFLFEEYSLTSKTSYNLASHPLNQNIKNITLELKKMNNDYTFNHPEGKIFLIDVFRLHEAIDDEIGAGGINGYVTNLIEHFILIHTIKGVYYQKKHLLNSVLFIKDGPLGFFGQTARMHKTMRNMINYLNKDIDLNIVGIEKSGPFVEHAFEIEKELNKGDILLLDNKYIYSYIKPGDPSTEEPFGNTSYYGSKIILKARDERLYVLTLPTTDDKIILNPTKKDFKNIDTILYYIERLKTDIYDNALLPIALVNKLVSISDHPSSALLEKFAKKAMNS